jgi:hypothetical protein
MLGYRHRNLEGRQGCVKPKLLSVQPVLRPSRSRKEYAVANEDRVFMSTQVRSMRTSHHESSYESPLTARYPSKSGLNIRTFIRVWRAEERCLVSVGMGFAFTSPRRRQ